MILFIRNRKKERRKQKEPKHILAKIEASEGENEDTNQGEGPMDYGRELWVSS